MKWSIENQKSMSPALNDKIIKSIEQGNLSKELLNTVVSYVDSNITFRSDNRQYVEKLVNSIVGQCYKMNIVIDRTEENGKVIYESNRIKYNLPREKDQWYLSMIKREFGKDNLSYHLHYTKDAENCHLIVSHDTMIVE